MAVITTSRNPGKQARLLARKAARELGLRYIGRGKSSIFKICEKAVFEGEKVVVIVNERLGKPDCFQVAELSGNSLLYSKEPVSFAGLEKFLKRAKE